MKTHVRSWLKRPLIYGSIWLLCLLPFLTLVWGAVQDNLGANPAEFLIRATGDWALRFVCLALAITPLRQWLGMPELALYRRTLGLYAYFYACWHLVCYAGFDRYFEWVEIYKDIGKRPFILVGFLIWVLLTPLALTSWNRVIRWLGAKRWQMLHRLVYVIAPLAVVHFWWMREAKHNFAEVTIYAAIVLALLLARVVNRWQKS